MTNKLVLGVVALVLVLSGCLGEGAECQPDDSALCEDPTTSLFCEEGILRKFKCPGDLGCTQNSQTKAVCDFRRSSVSASCPRLAATQELGFCSTTLSSAGNPSGAILVKCDKQTRLWREVMSCSSCTTNGLNATCNP